MRRVVPCGPFRRQYVEFILSNVTQILSLDPDRPICFSTNFKGIIF